MILVKLISKNTVTRIDGKAVHEEIYPCRLVGCDEEWLYVSSESAYEGFTREIIIPRLEKFKRAEWDVKKYKTP